MIGPSDQCPLWGKGGAEGPNNVMQWRRFYDLKGAHDAETTFEPDDEGTSVFHASENDEGGVSSFVSFPTHVFLGSIF